MSRSPERMSSYRRHFEGILAAPPAYQLRVCSPSPTRRGTRHRSASFTRSGPMGRKAISNKACMTSSVSMGALCFGMSMGLGPKLDLDAAAAENRAFMTTRTTERQEMVALNDRLAAYIENVRNLESKNKLLEAEIEALKSCHERPSGLRQLYESQLKELKRDAEKVRIQKDTSLAAKEAMLGQLDMLKAKYEEAVEARKKADHDIENLRPHARCLGLRQLSPCSGTASGGTAAARGEATSSDALTDGHMEEQATERSERKTVLIRTVKKDKDTYESDTHERTITISGAANDTDEE